ncbi:MAG: hypothetical protein QOE63_382 [Acidimicrobiaceae bacterium]|jgi:GNAT superfamily N-acetyltransferase
MEVGARPATATDLAELDELAAAAIAELVHTRGGSLYVRHDARSTPISELLDRPDALVLVGTIDDTPIGYAVATIEALRDGGQLAIVSDIFVLPDGRGVGVGEALMDEITAWSTAAGCIGIDSMVLPGNRDSKNFFETFGLTARAIVVHRSL